MGEFSKKAQAPRQGINRAWDFLFGESTLIQARIGKRLFLCQDGSLGVAVFGLA